jgi:prophage antirepressor-like protein
MTAQSTRALAPSIFQFEDSKNLRVVEIDGQIWFGATDVCRALQYSNTSDALSTHVDQEDRSTITLKRTPSETRGVPTNIINESGLYSLILSSKKPAAKKFKRWVTSEVLPTIRKTGWYEMPQLAPPALSSVVLSAMEAHDLLWLFGRVDRLLEFSESADHELYRLKSPLWIGFGAAWQHVRYPLPYLAGLRARCEVRQLPQT